MSLRGTPDKLREFDPKNNFLEVPLPNPVVLNDSSSSDSDGPRQTYPPGFFRYFADSSDSENDPKLNQQAESIPLAQGDPQDDDDEDDPQDDGDNDDPQDPLDFTTDDEEMYNLLEEEDALLSAGEHPPVFYGPQIEKPIKFGPNALSTHNPSKNVPPPRPNVLPVRLGFDCDGCPDFACTSHWLEWNDIGSSDDDTEAKAAAWMKAHNLCYLRFMCDHADGTSTLCTLKKGKGDYPLLVCPTCRSSRHIFEPLLAGGGGRLPIVTSLRLLYLYAQGGITRELIAKKCSVDANTVGSTFVRFDKILATEAWYHSFTIHREALLLEMQEILIMFQGDETTYSGSKYGKGKPTCVGLTQWFQTIVLLYNSGERDPKTGEEIYKIADFAMIPVADRRAHTLLRNIASCVPRGRKITTDCWRAYFGLGKDYEYMTVNHKKHFKDPVTLAHTNHVESLHRHLKAVLKGPLGKESGNRVIRVMATTVLYRGQMGMG